MPERGNTTARRAKTAGARKRKPGRPRSKRHAERLTITLPPERAKRIKQAVAEGHADSVSAYVAHVLESYEEKQSFLSDADHRWLEAEPREPRLDAWLESTTKALGWKR